MTSPYDDLTPSRRFWGRPGQQQGPAEGEPSEREVTADDLLRGQSAAVLAALARVELKIEVLAQRQEAQIDHLERELAALRTDLAAQAAPDERPTSAPAAVREQPTSWLAALEGDTTPSPGVAGHQDPVAAPPTPAGPAGGITSAPAAAPGVSTAAATEPDEQSSAPGSWAYKDPS